MSVLENLPTWGAIGLFSVASLMVAASPGPTWVYVAQAAARDGMGHGLTAAAGNILGVALHVVLCAVGLSAIIAASQSAMALLTAAGTIYLVYLGINRLRSTSGFAFAAGGSSQSLASAFLGASLINATNPKVLLLFLSLLPQFAAADRSFAIQAVTFGTVHILIATTILVVLVVTIGATGMRARPGEAPSTAWRVFNVLSGLVLIGFGILLGFDAVSRITA